MSAETEQERLDREDAEQDAFERELHEDYCADLDSLPPIDPATRRRVFALCAYRCPDHGCDLIECEDVDEHGAHVYYRCPAGDHLFGSAHDTVGGYYPEDDEIGVIRVEANL